MLHNIITPNMWSPFKTQLDGKCAQNMEICLPSIIINDHNYTIDDIINNLVIFKQLWLYWIIKWWTKDDRENQSNNLGLERYEWGNNDEWFTVKDK